MTETIILPAFLASALINGDTSSLNDEDMEWLTAAERYVAPGYVVACGEESFFSHSCDLPGFSLGADMLEYRVLYLDNCC